MTDKDGRESYRETLEKGRCPEKELFIKAFLDETGQREKMNLIDYVLICDRCVMEFDALREVTERTKDQ